ncbi:glycosyltransferase family 4 protein [Modestobacter sp. VKM Ac-2978]|uniref:glycosyltransferase family 4 protein n=1 Tax=Modestobacter sp. VKM Ac-2978 TaxID=3004132 RepID=UPI0022AA855C|nr:glycosyltransferase family 4 protein [Modestobacter sp. VKM Ac-2978]MCZ2846580.1 glycosyltransferase family 4 protein [Modestobacter sp. VKM Ac-2978]
MALVDRSNDQRLKVVVVGLNYAPETTGIAPYTTGLARHLSRAEHDVTVVAGHPHYPEWQLHPGYEVPRSPEDDRGVHLIRVAHPVPANPHGLARVWMEVVFALRAGLHLIRARPAVVVVVSPAMLALLPAVLLGRVLGFRVGVIVQDLYGAAVSEAGLGGGALARATAWLELFLFRRVQGIAVIHDVFRRKLIKAGIPRERIEVIPNWAHVTMPVDDDRAATRLALGWGDDDFIALHAGNMGAKQGLEGLIDVARLAEHRRSRVRVVLLGNGARKEALHAYAGGLSHASFLESLPEGRFEAALAAADCLVLHEKPGVVEMSVPSKLTTYFTAGRPVVAATDPKSGAAALMALSDGGLTVRAGDSEAILAAIETLADDPDTAKTLGQSGRYYAAEHLTGARSLAMYEAWTTSLATQPVSPVPAGQQPAAAGTSDTSH